MRHPIKLKLYCHLLFFIFILHCGCQDKNPIGVSNEPDTEVNKVKWLQDNAIHLSSIDPNNTDFADLRPLENVIKNTKVVMLGEQSHGDGTTFLAKVRLIKFLHQELGFDVLAFESGLYDCNKVWTEIKIEECKFQQRFFGLTQSSSRWKLVNGTKYQ